MARLIPYEEEEEEEELYWNICYCSKVCKKILKVLKEVSYAHQSIIYWIKIQ